jgi:hypothetical protein
MRSATARAVHTPKSLPGTDHVTTWREDAACLGLGDWWDASLDGERETAEEKATRHSYAIRICDTCPVRQQCADSVTPDDSGIRGGMPIATARRSGCDRPMVRTHEVPPGFIRHASRGRCNYCSRLAARATGHRQVSA